MALDDQVQNLIDKQNLIINNLTSILSLSSDAINKFSDLQTSVQNLSASDIFTNFQNFNSNIFNIASYYQQIYNILNKKYFLYNFIEDNYTENLNISLLNVEIFDENFNSLSGFNYNILNRNLSLSNIDNSINRCFIKFSQNLTNSQIYSDLTFTFSSKVDIDQNITSVLLAVSDFNKINEIYNNKTLNNTVMVVNGTKKYKIITYGRTVQNDVKYLTLHVFPNIIESSITTVTLHNYLFDDSISELNLVSYDVNDISSVYFSDADRDLTTGKLTIYNKFNFPKFVFNYSISGNIESRMVYAE